MSAPTMVGMYRLAPSFATCVDCPASLAGHRAWSFRTAHSGAWFWRCKCCCSKADECPGRPS